MDEPTTTARIACPYCGEVIEVFLEADIEGEMVLDCEVCCNPWRMDIVRRGAETRIDVRRLED